MELEEADLLEEGPIDLQLNKIVHLWGQLIRKVGEILLIGEPIRHDLPPNLLVEGKVKVVLGLKEV